MKGFQDRQIDIHSHTQQHIQKHTTHTLCFSHIRRLSPVLALYTLLHLILYYAYQLPFVSERVATHLQTLLGLRSLFAFPFSFESWTHFAGSVILLFSLVALFYFVRLWPPPLCCANQTPSLCVLCVACL